MDFRMAKRGDMEKFLELRVMFAQLMGKIDDVEGFRARTEKYLFEHIDREDLVIFLAFDGGKIVASCMACIMLSAPVPSCPFGKFAELLNVYTAPEYRRKGYSKKLILMTIDELRARGVKKLELFATPEGKKVYDTLGFMPSDGYMTLKI